MPDNPGAQVLTKSMLDELMNTLGDEYASPAGDGISLPSRAQLEGAISMGAIEYETPYDFLPATSPAATDEKLKPFLQSLRAHELKSGGQYAIFVPQSIYDTLTSIIGGLRGLPWTGVILPAIFNGDGSVQLQAGTLDDLLAWVQTHQRAQ